MIQEQLKVFSKCLFINPVGGVTPSGTVGRTVQQKIYCSGPILSSEQVYFYLLKFHAQNYKDINAALGMLGRLNETGKWNP